MKGQVAIVTGGGRGIGAATALWLAREAAVIGVHLTGAFNLVRAVTPLMKARGHGRIVNMSSLASLGADGMACYATVKAGLQGLMRALAVELGPHGITVNAVAPSLIGTARLKASPVFGRLSELSLRGQSIPREGVPDDVANAIAFFASAHSGFITGEVLFVTGGIRQLW